MKPVLRGTGVLAIWNGITPGNEAAFLRWHVREHIPERMSVPGFLRARRYVALSGSPRYFNFYEVASPEVLQSPAYLERLNTPSGWTRSVVPHFSDTSRTICHVVASLGYGVSGTVAALRLATGVAGLSAVVRHLAEAEDVAAVHLLEQAGGAPRTTESQMRARPDETARGILLVEGADPASLAAVVETVASDAAIADATGEAPRHRGIYQLDFLLDRGDVV